VALVGGATASRAARPGSGFAPRAGAARQLVVTALVEQATIPARRPRSPARFCHAAAIGRLYLGYALSRVRASRSSRWRAARIEPARRGRAARPPTARDRRISVSTAAAEAAATAVIAPSADGRSVAFSSSATTW
jgi:hypothetical protein